MGEAGSALPRFYYACLVLPLIRLRGCGYQERTSKGSALKLARKKRR